VANPAATYERADTLVIQYSLVFLVVGYSPTRSRTTPPPLKFIAPVKITQFEEK
jgi:hypothetical protein